uniref:Uncharacterized protein n=1 Tax=Caenorhabditis japonica TaxID=281687 RepID=A0A8R1EJ64_CAEJA
MCIGFIKVAKTADEKYKLIILNNRDEKLDRPTAEMHWHDGILSGVDEQDEARGTWLGLNRGGKIGMLLSITQPVHTKNQTAPSRGAIISTGKEKIKALVKCFNFYLFMYRYGTRSHTLITIDNNDKVTILERRMIAATEVDKSEWIDQKFEFCLDPL